MRSYDPEKLQHYVDGFEKHLSNVKSMLEILNNQPRNRDTDIIKESLVKNTSDLTQKIGTIFTDSMLDYCDVQVPYLSPDLVTHTFNVPELDAAFDISDEFEDDDEEYFDDDDDDYEAA